MNQSNLNWFTGIVNHNATQGCQKCTVRGRRINNRVCYAGTNYPVRTNSEFRSRAIPKHHREDSIVERLPINMIEDFVIADELHLLHLGVMKKCLLMWKDGQVNSSEKWTHANVRTLNEMLKSINNDMPTDIHRSVRGIDCIKFWKGTELRTFLLYLLRVLHRTG